MMSNKTVEILIVVFIVVSLLMARDTWVKKSRKRKREMFLKRVTVFISIAKDPHYEHEHCLLQYEVGKALEAYGVQISYVPAAGKFTNWKIFLCGTVTPHSKVSTVTYDMVARDEIGHTIRKTFDTASSSRVAEDVAQYLLSCITPGEIPVLA